MKMAPSSETPFLTLIFDVLAFGILGIVLALVVDMLIKPPKVGEPIQITIIWLVLQLVLAAIIITLVVKLAPRIINREPDEFGGLTIFVLLFFAAQEQFRYRLSKITSELVGYNITSLEEKV